MSKFKIIKDYQLTTEDKKIIILKAKVFIENYIYTNKDVRVKLDPEMVENNPDYFQFIDWKTDLTNYLKANKIPQPAIVAKKLFPYIEDNYKDIETISMVSSEPDNGKNAELEKQIVELKTQLSETQAKLDNTNNSFEKLATDSAADKAELNSKLTKAVTIAEELETELARVNKQLAEKNTSGGSIEKSYKDQIAKLELELSSTKLKKTEYTKEVEEEMITKLKEVNDRLEAVIKREGEVRSAEMEANNVLLQAKDIKDRNSLIVLDIDSREKALDLKLNDLAVREKRLEAFDKDKIIEEALLNFEKSIPWQYWRDSSK